MPNRRLALLLPAALASAALPALATPAAAQQRVDPEERVQDWLDRCRNDRSDGDHACEVRETTISARGGPLHVDGGQNGGISVFGWDRNEIKVVARIEARAERDGDARALLRDVEIRTAPAIRAEGPRTRSREGWWVSFDVYVPRRADLDLETTNGGIRVADVEGAIRFDAVNGGVDLSGVAGDVRGSTQNGGVRVTLDGERWRGSGLDVRSQNGGVAMAVPARYDADLEIGTMNGHMDLDFPVTISGRIGRSISTRLGAGGAPLRVRTMNGGVSVRRR